MGIHDREYYRDDTSTVSPRISVTTGLIILHVSLFFLLALGTDKFGRNPILQWGEFDLAAIQRGEIWRLFTSHLIPSRDLFTIILGMYLLYWAGRPSEDYYGGKRFLAFYLLAALVAGVTKLVLGLAGLSPHPGSIGLAAPLFAVMTLFAFHEPRRIIMVFFVLPVQVGHLVAVLIGVYLFAEVLSFGKSGEFHDAPSVLAAAAFAAFFFYRGADWLAGIGASRPRRSTARRLKIYDVADVEPEAERPAAKPAPRRGTVDEHLEAKLDEVLEKLAKFGPEQLTEEEQQVLMKASEAYQRLRK